MDLVAFAVPVVCDSDLAGQRGNQEILAIQIGHEQPVVARALRNRVEPAVGILLEPPERREVILEAVIVAVPEEAQAKLLVVKQEAAKIRLERLDADPHRVKIVAGRDIAEVVIEERFLHADEMVEAMARLRWLDEQHAAFGHIDVVHVERQRDAIFDIGRLERGAALEQRRAHHNGLRQHGRKIVAEHVGPARVLGRLDTHRNREAARLEHRIADEVGDEEPVMPPDRQPRHLVRVYRPITLVGVLVIRVPPAFLYEPEALD